MMYNKSGLAGDCKNNLQQQRERDYSELLAVRVALSWRKNVPLYGATRILRYFLRISLSIPKIQIASLNILPSLVPRLSLHHGMRNGGCFTILKAVSF